MIGDKFDTILELLKRLEEARIFYTLAHNQEDAISIQVVVPGQLWEIDYHANGDVDVEIFKSDGSIYHSEAIEQLFRDFSD